MPEGRGIRRKRLMSIDNYYQGLFTPICDVCGAELPTEFDFNEAVNAKKDAGWKTRKVDGQWQDICCDCQGD